MKTLALGVIALLLALNALTTAGDARKYQKLLLEKLENTRLAHGILAELKLAKEKLVQKLAHKNPDKESMAQESSGVSIQDYETFWQCVNDTGATEGDVETYFENAINDMTTHDMKCIAGCYFEWGGITVDGEFNKEVYTILLSIAMDEDVAREAADDCEAIMADVPHENCALGESIEGCLAKIAPKIFEEFNS